MEEMCGARNLRERGPARDALRAEFGLGLHGPVAGRGAALEGRPRAPPEHVDEPEPRVAAPLEAVAAAAGAVLVWLIRSVLCCFARFGALSRFR